MRDELYRDLVDVVTAIRRSADPSRASEASLAEWDRWARGFCSGVYSRKSAGRAAQALWQYAAQTQPLPMLACAAACAARAVSYAAEGDEMTARSAVRSAREWMKSFDSSPVRPPQPIARIHSGV